MTLTLNGQDYNAGSFLLLASTKRSQIAGTINIRDQIIGSLSVTNHNLSGIFVILLGNTDSSGNAVAHITTTTSGSYSFNGSSKVVVLPTGLPNDQARAGVAINAFAGASIIAGLPVLNATSLLSAGSIVGTGNLTGSIKLPGGFSFNGAYNLEIIHPVSGLRPLAGVQPSSLSSGLSSFSNAPQYSVFNLSAGQWKVRFISAGYVTVEGLVNIQANTTTNFDIITMVPGSQLPASIAGRAINAITNSSSGMSGLQVYLRPGINVTSGPLATAQDGITILPPSLTANDGSFAIVNVPAGNYTLEIKGANVASAYRTVVSAGADTPASQNILVSPLLNTDEVRVVLSWNAEPRDLDSHLEYGSSAPNQVVWNDKVKLGGDLTLDVDVVTGFGPETVTLKGSTWSQSRRGYSVYNWSRECKARNFFGSCTDYAELYESGAIVRVYRSNGLVRSYVVGNGQVGRWWQLFCFNADKSIVDVGAAGCSQSSFFNASKN